MEPTPDRQAGPPLVPSLQQELCLRYYKLLVVLYTQQSGSDRTFNLILERANALPSPKKSPWQD